MTVVPARRKRQCGPKTKTGCQTCKIRRIKCDEAKPSCKRCTSTGRHCDGYSTDPLLLSPSSAVIQRISTHIPGNTREKRGFRFFISNTAAELTGYFTSCFWEHYILQASTAEPSLRHAVIAIGALHEEFSSKRLEFTHDNDPRPKQESQGTGFAVNQYTKAISHLRRSLCTGTQASLTALMSCILFVCFDSLRGNFDSAMLHLQSGLKILMDVRTRGSGREEDFIIEKHIVPLFVRLSIQAILYIDTRDPISRRKFAEDLEMIEESHVEEGAFRSLEDARESLNRAAGGMLRMFYTCDGDKSMSSQPPEAFTMYTTYSVLLEQWDKDFNTFMSAHSSNFVSRQVRGAALLKIHHTTAHVMCLSTPIVNDPRTAKVAMNSAQEYERFTPQFLIVLNLARSLIAAAEQDSKKGKPSLTFSTDLGVVGPLYYLCTKCTSKEVREQALALLARCPRREGMWDSIMGTRMIREFWEIEKRHKVFEMDTGGGGSGTSLSEYINLVLVDGGRWEWKLKWEDEVRSLGLGSRSASEVSEVGDDWWGLLNGQGIHDGDYMFDGGEGSEIWSEASL